MLKTVLKPHRAFLLAGSAAEQKLFLMVKLIPESEVARSRADLSIVLVIDTSGSMREFADQEAAMNEAHARGLVPQQQASDGKTYSAVDIAQQTKIDQAIEAAHRLIDDERLLPGDRVAVVHFDTGAMVLAPLTPLSNRSDLHQAVDRLREHSGETFMAKGMELAAQLLQDVPQETAKRVFLLTDGATRAEGQCKRLAGTLAEANTPVVAIGIGPEYNESLMMELAATSRGRPYHLQTTQQLQEILEAEVGSSVREVITDLQAKCATVKGAAVSSVTRVYPGLCDVETGVVPLRLGNIAAGDYTIFIVELTVAGLARPESRVRLAQLTLTGSIPGQGQQMALEPQDVFVGFSTDEAAVAAVDPEVLNYVQQKNVDRMLQNAVGQATVNAGQAKHTIQAALGMTKRIGNSAMTRVLESALDELNKTGSISAGTRKTVALGGKTKTMKVGGPSLADEGPSDEEIRRLSGV
jgi:Ca-activated chloride channel family protein